MEKLNYYEHARLSFRVRTHKYYQKNRCFSRYGADYTAGIICLSVQCPVSFLLRLGDSARLAANIDNISENIFDNTFDDIFDYDFEINFVCTPANAPTSYLIAGSSMGREKA